MILRSTGRFSQKALKSSLMCGSAAGSYTQWRSTEATDVRCDIIFDGNSPSLEVHHISAEMMTSDSKHLSSFRPTERHESCPMGFVHLQLDNSRTDLDIMRAASLEWSFALRMARRVSTCVDLTARSDESRSPCRRPTRLESAGLDPRRQRDRIFLGQIHQLRNHEAACCSGAIRNHPDSWWLSDLLQYLRDLLEWRERVQEAHPVVPRHGHGIYPLLSGVRIRRYELDESSVGECRKQIDLWLAPLGKHGS